MKMKILSLLLVLVLVIGITALNVMAEETTAPAAHENHCVCGGNGNGRGDHVCADSGVITEWIPFSTDLLVPTSNEYRFDLPAGNYYLTEKTVLTGTEINIIDGTEVTFCLNGYELTSSRRLFRVNGTLNITDCQPTRDGKTQNGKIIGNAAQAPVLYGYSGGHINLYRGILTAKSGVTRNYGGVLALATDAGNNATSTAGSSMTMYGGTIDASKLTLVKTSSGGHGSGGAIILMGAAAKDGNPAKPCTFIQYGGTVKGAKSVETNGAAIAANATDTVKILGNAIVEAGDAANYGDGIYGSTGSTLVVGGNAKVEDMYILSTHSFSVENLEAGAKIGLSAGKTNFNTLAEMTEAEAAYFTSNLAGRPLVWADGKLTFANHANHCVCGGNLTDEAAIAAHGECVVEENWIGLNKDNLYTYLVASDTADGGNEGYYMFADEYDDACFYLEESITMTKPIEIHNGDNVSLCLNGYTFTYKKGMKLSAFRVWGNLNLCDCTGKGKATTNNDNSGGLIYLHDSKAKADFAVNIYGGTYTATDANTTQNGGVISVGNASAATTFNATLNIYGGTITGGTGTMGGNICITQSKSATGRVSLNIYGGSITNGTACTRGGNVYVHMGNFAMYGGTMTGGTLVAGVNSSKEEVTPEYGADLAFGATSPMAILLNGEVTIGEIGAYGSASDSFAIELGDNFSATSPIKVSAKNADKVIKSAKYADLAYLVSANDAYQLTCEGAYIYLRDAALDYHCRCGGNLTDAAREAVDHTNCNDILWEDLTLEKLKTMDVQLDKLAGEATDAEGKKIGVESYILPKGNYKLVENIVSDKALLIPGDTEEYANYTVNIDLNGHTLSVVEENAPWRVIIARGLFTLSDSAYDPANTDAQYGKVVGTAAKGGAAIYVCTLKTVEETDSAGKKKNVTVAGETRIYGGEIVHAQTESGVAGPLAVSGKFHLMGGKITGFVKTTASGGAITLNDSGNVTLWGGVVQGGEANRGGAIYSSKDTQKLSIRGDAVVTGGSAKQGGNIYALGNVSVDEEAVISGGNAFSGTIDKKSVGGGGNIYSEASVSVKGGQIIGGTAKAEGGNIYTSNLTMTGGTVADGVSASYGGNIYLTGNSEISGGQIKDGLSTSTSRSGGNICVANKSTLTIKGNAEIFGGKANEGGNISIRDGATLNIEGGKIHDGEAVKHGGNIVAFTTLNISGGEIYNGKAVNRGGNISTYGNYGKITITGGHIYDGMLCGSYTNDKGELVNPEANARYGANIGMLSTDNKPLELTILGGEIGGLGADSLEVSSVHIQSSGDEITTTVGGTAVIDSLRMGTGRMVTIHADGFAEGASIGVERFEIAGLFAPEASADYAQYFHATENGVTVQANETGLVLVSENPYWAFDVSNKQIAGAKTITEAMAIEGAGFVRLVQDHTTTEVVTGDVYLDMYGNTLTGLTVNGTLYAADYQTNSYEDGMAGSLVNFTGDVQTAYKSDKEHFSNTMLYVAVQDETGAWSFHALSATLTHTSLDPANDALGYKVEIKGDSQALSMVEAFGMDIYVSENSIKTYTKALNAEGLYTLRLKNIMKNKGGEMTIYGAPVVVVDGFAYTFSTTSTTMMDTIKAVNALTNLTDAQKTAVYELYAQYESVMSAWLGEKNNIATWAPGSEEIPAA